MSPLHGIVTIDTGYQRPQFCAAYLIVERGRAAFVDCGTNHSVPRLLAALQAQGLAADAVDRVILTHVHLDHAGGAGALLRELPNARLVVHPRGAPHMIDPSRLVASARAVYGDAEFSASYGELVPVPEARVEEAADGHVVDLAGRPLLCADTPGHARHHLAVWDARSRSWFAGDIFGLSYRELDTARGAFAIPTTSPVQFDPEQMRASVRRMLGEAPEAVFVTHYGRVADVQRLGADLIAQVEAMVDAARALADDPHRHQRLVEALQRLYVERAQRHGVADARQRVPELLGMDIELNAQGLEVWLDRDRA
ncbi:MBL fold metallo-hydrolase [Luteimonas sp. RD2P54]|uniref:MBL fold metallo-hydrolase n=1 Tax=Luteimonas endophytica TaxID=3042023 RepID=A0ABT6J894_9GAMM|nr:MBL fold metallo-hydrolase [Luteimonas endophytica]MDH5823046.1 MBL fold metallo-hydrolase [Luteimonas endophytica]